MTRPAATDPGLCDVVPFRPPLNGIDLRNRRC